MPYHKTLKNTLSKNLIKNLKRCLIKEPQQESKKVPYKEPN